MGLADKYVEQLKSQGINVAIDSTKQKKPHTKPFIAAIGAAVAAVLYPLIFVNYNSCSISAGNLASANTSILKGSFSQQCAINATMYSVAAAFIIAILVLVLLKVLMHSDYLRIK